ncbi:hypothetical protein [Absidia glauca]|uniref:Extracellular membrane protein CFEM domain-containing protein n=1 Tax=Absidia glauca TaxID=4829 RepID=A0A163J7U2_ABSGL|nr:hypothetical protein [Absidia glauca]
MKRWLSYTIIALASLATTTLASGNLPFDTLPKANCQVPTVCGQVKNVQCRCDDTITVCMNESRQYCWGSQTLHQTSGCPSIPSACASTFNSTASCLCNSTNLLCIDQYSHVCYGAIQGGSVSLLPLGGISPASSSIPPMSSSSSMSPTSSSPSPSSKPSGTMAATSTPIPNHGNPSLSSSLALVIIPLLLCITSSSI